jgi:hypothetical protein
MRNAGARLARDDAAFFGESMFTREREADLSRFPAYATGEAALAAIGAAVG